MGLSFHRVQLKDVCPLCSSVGSKWMKLIPKYMKIR